MKYYELRGDVRTNDGQVYEMIDVNFIIRIVLDDLPAKIIRTSKNAAKFLNYRIRRESDSKLLTFKIFNKSGDSHIFEIASAFKLKSKPDVPPQ
ncbi:hypothetical protein COT12_01640 [Candidatus Berkelbacteria bacterium CG08_land_8_20_14_0_20_39_8]|uniref:Uncharacterized protein n=1 Tax=Candidatus Berkelbacteria bacterium CG08_land_8_20_14_0_20_39_8 TaxID=1974511 RepID=A0A2M6YC99_9BACT|nr:MAG: hypothetical protein COT12_01640 [Candidatus Berkelbacteria bacterium CG08_land_8_20_14_0_20_39_8]